MSLELELQADRLRRERLVQALAVLGAAGGAAFMFWVFGPREVTAIDTPDGRAVRFELSTWAWIRGNFYALILIAVALLALAKLVRTQRELTRVRAALGDIPRATIER